MSKKIKKKIILLFGPTASGKSEISIKLGEKFDLPIIPPPSKLLYKDFDIGTAKPTKSQQNLVKHYMIDLLKSNEQSNLSWFLDKSRKIISELNHQNQINVALVHNRSSPLFTPTQSPQFRPFSH